MSHRDDAYDVFNNVNDSEASAETHIHVPVKDSVVAADSEDNQIDFSNLADGHDHFETEHATSDHKTKAKSKSLIDKIVPVVFCVIIVIGVVGFALAIFFPNVFDSSETKMNPTSIQQTQQDQALATNQLIDKLQGDVSAANEALAKAKDSINGLSQQNTQLIASEKQQQTQISSLLLANQQSQQIISSLNEKLSQQDKTLGRGEPSKSNQKISSTKTYQGVAISSIYQGQAWIREGEKISVLTEGDKFRGSIVISIDPVSRSVLTSNGVIK